MFIFSTMNTKLPVKVFKYKRVRKSPRLQKNYEQKGQVDNLPTGIQPDPTETLDAGPTTSKAHNIKLKTK